MKFYLAGPVGYDAEGVAWKKGMKDFLRQSGHEVYDPIENDFKYPQVSKMNILKENSKENWAATKEIMQEIFRDDCRYITNCDFLICYFKGRSLGTAAEQCLAYFLTKLGGKRIKTINIFDCSFNPDEWVLCCSDFVFFSIEDCLKFLKRRFKDETLCHSHRLKMQCSL
jgi:hypothetical protein